MYNKTEVNDGLNRKIGGSGHAACLPTNTDTRVIANSGVQEHANCNIGIGGPADNYCKLRVAGDVYVNGSESGKRNCFGKPAKQSSAHLTPDELFYDGLIRSMDWQMELVYGTNELLLASPVTDFNSGCVSIGGYLANCTKQSNLTVNNYTGMVGIGTNYTHIKIASKWRYHCKLVCQKRRHFFTIPIGGWFNFIISVIVYTYGKTTICSIFYNDRTFNSNKAGRGMIISLLFDGPQNCLHWN